MWGLLSFRLGRYRVEHFRISEGKAIMSRVKILFGTYFFGSISKETIQEFFSILKAHNVKDLDTAYGYVSLALF